MNSIRVLARKGFENRRYFARIGKGRGSTTVRDRAPSRVATRSAPIVPVDQAWLQVTDEASGQKYWWNQQTNETTHLGAPDPREVQAAQSATPPAPAQQGGMLSGLGGVMAEGFAFGVGSSIARSAVNSVFNSFGGGDDGGDDGTVDI